MPQTLFANVVVDISHESLDRFFQYRVPDSLRDRLKPGMQVLIPFGKGNRQIAGYVLEITGRASFDPSRIKEITQIAENGVAVESQLIQLADWIRNRYGSTMIQALKTVIPIRQKIRSKEKSYLKLAVPETEAKALLAVCQSKKNQRARARLLEALLADPVLPKNVVTEKLNISTATIKHFTEQNIVTEFSEIILRNPVKDTGVSETRVPLNEGQRSILQSFAEDLRHEVHRTYLIHGVTGSGKTEVYMEMIADALSRGRQAIMLIPEIALTYQTVMRFYRRFGGKVSIMNSRLSQGERYDQFVRAKKGEISIMIGPRSALFTPFEHLGLIIIDEEHENAYKSETTPRYHAREVAVRRAEMCGASVVLGSATPSVESYYHALNGDYRLFTLTERAKARSSLAHVDVVDLREELKAGNKSIFSRQLFTLIQDRLQKREQTILFLNRRGYAGFVSCRECGEPLKCPHCDVSLKAHKNGRLVCHYCGYEEPLPKKCPKCGSPYIAGFGTGTERVETMVKQYFPEARVLRMDLDTTSGKDGHEKILSAFSNEEADILIGTQMIVKGHDFPKVTLVGVLAADLSLYSEDYTACERTFQLLTQAAGRAGRDETPGEVVIQTYSPEHYAVRCAAAQDYVGFYREEMAYRELMQYPPAACMMNICLCSGCEDRAKGAADAVLAEIKRCFAEQMLRVIGPASPYVGKIKDQYYQMLYLKHRDISLLIAVRRHLEQFLECTDYQKDVMIQYDFR